MDSIKMFVVADFKSKSIFMERRKHVKYFFIFFSGEEGGDLLSNFRSWFPT